MLSVEQWSQAAPAAKRSISFSGSQIRSDNSKVAVINLEVVLK
jgi:hypothetical protein